jgi:hypothetical protein
MDSIIYYNKAVCCALSVFTRTYYISYIFLCEFVYDCVFLELAS